MYGDIYLKITMWFDLLGIDYAWLYERAARM